MIETNGAVLPSTPFILAMKEVLPMINCGKHTKVALKSVLKHVEISAKALGFEHIPTGLAKRRHIKLLFDHLPNNKATWTNNTSNYYRGHLCILFNETLQFDAIDFNPILGIKKAKSTKRLREILSPEQRQIVDQHLRKEKQLAFRLYMKLFFHSLPLRFISKFRSIKLYLQTVEKSSHFQLDFGNLVHP